MSSTLTVVKNNVKMPLLLGEGVVFFIYFIIAFIEAIKADTFDKKRKKTAESEVTVEKEESKEE